MVLVVRVIVGRCSGSGDSSSAVSSGMSYIYSLVSHNVVGIVIDGNCSNDVGGL